VIRPGARRRPWLALALGAVLVLLVAGWVAGAMAGPAGEWVAVREGPLVREVEITGTLEAARSSILTPPQIRGMWEYKVTLLAPEGEEVEAGTPVLGFDASELQRQLAQRRNEAEEADKELEKSLGNLHRRREDLALELAEAEAAVRRQRLAAGLPAELEAAIERQEKTLSLQLAESRVEHVRAKIAHEQERARAEMAALTERRTRARERIAELESSMARMTVTAPRRGTVLYTRPRGRGEKVKLGDSVWQGRAVVEIPDLTAMRGQGEVDEADMGRLAVGQPVRLTLDAHPGIEHTGHIREIAGAVTQGSRGGFTRVVAVTVDLDATDPQRMRPGMRFRGRVEIERSADLLLLPADAVLLTPEGPRVRRRTWLGSEEVAVTLGRGDDREVEVISGLAAGDRVLRQAAEELPASTGER